MAGTGTGPVKVGYTGNVPLRRYQLARHYDQPIVMHASFPVHCCLGMVAERYAHFLLRDRHWHSEWFHATPEEAMAVIPYAIQAAEEGLPLMPSLWKAGEQQKGGEKVQNLRLPAGSHMQIEAVLMEGEVRSDFIRAAVAAELERRTPKPRP